MRAIDLIRKKRDAAELTREEIEWLIRAYTEGQVPDYQMSAWLMAVLIRGMTGAELAALTEAMLHSGQVLDFPNLPAPKVDKHSTGGVGDKTSLVLAPLAASAGLVVPMISGRGLGHTGGTLDKLEAIPGFRIELPMADFRRNLAEVGCAMIGQNAQVAPADKKIYALRDVTATVESPALICASIMSKKLAEGLDALLLDVKTGSGAFMKTLDAAAHLAGLMVETGTRMGKRVVALITDMDQPLGRKVGNALEVEECLEVMRGGGPDDLRELCLEEAAWMLYLGNAAKSVAEGKEIAGRQIASGAALAKFRQMVEAQGGDAAVVDDPARLPQARQHEQLISEEAGYVGSIDCEQVGVASLVIGGGRERKEDVIDPAVGLVLHKKVGDAVERGEPVCTIHFNSDARLGEARRLLAASFHVAAERPAGRRPLVHRVIGAAQPAAVSTS
jgi:pyrimidine-nucleoside phosphorylase